MPSIQSYRLFKRFIIACQRTLIGREKASIKAMRRYRETMQTRFADFGVDPGRLVIRFYRWRGN
jgi:hypothetical protein